MNKPRPTKAKIHPYTDCLHGLLFERLSILSTPIQPRFLLAVRLSMTLLPTEVAFYSSKPTSAASTSTSSRDRSQSVQFELLLLMHFSVVCFSFFGVLPFPRCLCVVFGANAILVPWRIYNTGNCSTTIIIFAICTDIIIAIAIRFISGRGACISVGCTILLLYRQQIISQHSDRLLTSDTVFEPHLVGACIPPKSSSPHRLDILIYI